VSRGGGFSGTVVFSFGWSCAECQAFGGRHLPDGREIGGFDRAFNDAERRRELASGFVLTSEGVILTNYHAIRGMTRAVVRMPNLDAYDEVQVTATDRVRDLALIKIKAVNLVPLRLGRSAPVEIGDMYRSAWRVFICIPKM